jgi:FkbM family methyltransferase
MNAADLNAHINRFYDQNCAISLSNAVSKDNPIWIDHSLAKPTLHDPDYVIFRHFRDPGTTVLDVGANWGYSVISMIAAGCGASIISFEPLSCFTPHLSLLASRLPGRYSFVQCGIGARSEELRFVTPVLNGEALTAYASASEVSHRSHLWQNMAEEIARRGIASGEITLEFSVSYASVKKLDEAVSNVDDIEAIKIDVEGHEPAAILGGLDTLQRCKPLLMVETANRNPDVVAPLTEAGYLFAVREGNCLRQSADISDETNGFFVHRDRLHEYARRGILAGGRAHIIRRVANYLTGRAPMHP